MFQNTAVDHDMACAVHNGPAYPGPCNCYATLPGRLRGQASLLNEAADMIERLQGAMVSMADDNSPHDAQRTAEHYAAEVDAGWVAR